MLQTLILSKLLHIISTNHFISNKIAIKAPNPTDKKNDQYNFEQFYFSDNTWLQMSTKLNHLTES